MMYHPLYPLFQINSFKVEWDASVQNIKLNSVNANTAPEADQTFKARLSNTGVMLVWFSSTHITFKAA